MKIELVYLGDDWCGLYVDGALKVQGHSISPRDFAEAVGAEYRTRDLPLPEELDTLPESLAELPG